MLIFKGEKYNINMYLPEKYAFICFASFEKRCLSIPNLLERKHVNKAYVIRNTDRLGGEYNKENTNQILKLFEQSKVVQVDIQRAITISNAMSDIVGELIQEKEQMVIIDISTFTHETLLILMKLVYANRMYFTCVRCLYNGASHYSFGDSPQNMWLSKGCRDVRNVIGYPGKIDSTRKNHLIIMTGFEIERATGLVELLVPDILTLGDGSEPTENEHGQVMGYFKEKFDSWKNSFVGISTNSFEFSCKDVEKTIEILKEKTQNKQDNFFIVPLNTKLSTLAVGITALDNPEIQVCYAIPEIYNMNNYSKPSNNVTIVDMNQLFEKVGR